MNALTTTSQAWTHPRDSAAVLRANGLAGAALAGLEWQRSCQAEAAVGRLLRQHGVAPRASVSRVAMLRQGIAAALGNVGKDLARVLRSGIVPATTPATGTFNRGS